MAVVVPRSRAHKQCLSKAIQAGHAAGLGGTSSPLPTSDPPLPAKPGHRSPHPPSVRDSGLLQECSPSPSHPAQWSMVLWASKADLPRLHPASFLGGSCLEVPGRRIRRRFTRVAEGLEGWPQELGLCPLDAVWLESRMACGVRDCPVSGSGGTGGGQATGPQGRAQGT